MPQSRPIYLLPGLRTPFTRVDGELKHLDSIGLSVPVVRAMMKQLASDKGVDLTVWGTVAPNLTWSNIAREVFMDAAVGPSVPAFSTVMACATSAAAAIEAAGLIAHGNGELALCGGVESMSRVQLGLTQGLSDFLRRLTQARNGTQRLSVLRSLRLDELGLYIPSVANRTTGKSMGEHTEEMAKEWKLARDPQDELALASHRKAVSAQERGFFKDLVVEVEGVRQDAFPRRDTTLEKLSKLKPAFDRKSGRGTLTAGNSSPLTDGAAGIWVASDEGLKRLPESTPRVRLIDWQLAAVDIHREGLLMAPPYAIPRLLARHGLRYESIALWEIHEAFAAQVLANIAALESEQFRAERVKLAGHDFGVFPRDRVNPNGGSIALGHPFGATGARILSQATKELAEMPAGSKAIVSICADGGLGSVCLLESV